MNRPYVLVVDDNKITTKLLKRYLEANGYEAGEAFDGIECLEKVDARMPDAVVLDVMMPRMDGYETVSKLKENDATKHIPVVIVTALNDIPNQLKSIESGGDDFLSKPIEEKLLVAKVKLMTNLNLANKELNKYKSLFNDLLNDKISKEDAKKSLEN
ncbi:MAG: response regulator [Desulfobulbaceae bacterium]|nr:response regulator [Candidatus Kapabacteria bacterium]MBS4000632.1 response regulator [Desulfobulbaceae bacterium]